VKELRPHFWQDRESDRRSRDRRLQDRVRAVDRCDQQARLRGPDPRVTSRTQNGDRGQIAIRRYAYGAVVN